MGEVGKRAPSFTLPGSENGEIRRYTLEEGISEGPLLLGVYPFDFSPVCTVHMCQLDDMDWYRYKRNLTIWGISRDGPYAHVEFASQENLNFPLLSDTTGKMLRAYDVLNEEKDGVEEVAQRSMFLIDTDGIVQFRWVAEDNWDEDGFGLNPVEAAIEAI